MLRAALLLYAAASVAAVQTTAVGRCEDVAAELPLNTHVSGCETPPCQLPQGQDAVIGIVFRAPRVLHNMTSVVQAYWQLLSFKYPLREQAVTCDFLTNTYCPVLEGEVVSYALNFYIDPNFPAYTSVTLEFYVQDEAATPLFCVRFPLQVVPPARRAGTAATHDRLRAVPPLFHFHRN